MNEKVIKNIPVNVLNAARLCVAGKKDHRDYIKYILIDVEKQEIAASDGYILYYSWGLKLEGTINQALISIFGKALGETATLDGDRLIAGKGLQTQFVNHFSNIDKYPELARILPAKSDVIEETGFVEGFKTQYLTRAERCWGKNTAIRLLNHNQSLLMRPADRLELLYIMPIKIGTTDSTYYSVN